MKTRNKIKGITEGAIIAAIYVVLTYLTNILGLANGAIQCRLSEAMCVLPVFTFSAIPGLFIGCLMSNLLTGCAIFDVVFGSIATLIGAYGTYCFRKHGMPPFLYPLCPVISNTVIIPFVLKYAYGLSGGIWYFILTVGIGEIISCGILGMFLYFSLLKKVNIFH